MKAIAFLLVFAACGGHPAGPCTEPPTTVGGTGTALDGHEVYLSRCGIACVEPGQGNLPLTERASVLCWPGQACIDAGCVDAPGAP